jgi:molecular chaperone GrpE
MSMTEEAEEIREQNESATAQDESAQPDLGEQLQAAQAEIGQLRDRYLRSVAELDNYRKRIVREREQQQLRSKMELIRQLLPVADDFALALSHVPAEYAAVPWIEGITLIHRKLETYLDGVGVSAIEAVGQVFDPHYHDALVSEASADYPDGTVLEEIRKGYLMGDEVLRPTLVKVSAGPAQG